MKVRQSFHGASYKEYTDSLDPRVQAETKNKKSESKVRGYIEDVSMKRNLGYHLLHLKPSEKGFLRESVRDYS